MNIIVTDMEGVLMPEFWQEISKRTKVKELMITTREEPDFDKLMNFRIEQLNKNKITIEDINKVVNTICPLDGANKFIKWVRKHCEILILTDTYKQFIQPVIGEYGWPTALFHTLEVDESGNILGYNTRVEDQKVKTVQALKKLNFNVIAIGDSYNDIGMLRAADKGILFKPSDNVKNDNKDLQVCSNYEDLKKVLSKVI